MLTTAKSNKEKLSKEYNQLNEKVTKLQNDLEEQIHQNANLIADNGQKQLSLKAKEEDIAAAKAETARVTKIQGLTAKKLKSLEEAREAAEKQRDTLKTGLHPTHRVWGRKWLLTVSGILRCMHTKMIVLQHTSNWNNKSESVQAS